jgi:hypothetical protein
MSRCDAAMSDHELSDADLAQFTGSEHWYRHGLNRDEPCPAW